MNIVILDGYTISRDDLNWASLLKFGKLTYYPRTGAEQLLSRLGRAEAVLTSKCLIGKEVIDRCPHLQYIGVLATGYNNVDTFYAKQQGLAVTNIPYYSGSSVAQATFSLLLEIANQVGLHNEAVHRGDWNESADFCFTLSEQLRLAGRTMGIVGFGNIGRQVAQIADAFGMEILVHTPHPPTQATLIETEMQHSVTFTDLDSLLRQSDIISLHCPLTEDTREMINFASIARMKAGAILINTARGPLVQEHDLASALKSGKLMAAGIDVLTVEPPMQGNPLIGLRNCIITPHISWVTKEARARLIEIATLNIDAYLRGEMRNRIV
jgi:glycerate dehydrogenase